MDDENMALRDPDETADNINAAGISPNEIEEDWNSPPQDGFGVDDSEDEDEPREGGSDEGAVNRTDKKMDKLEADQSFTLKHLSEVRTVGRDEVVALAQKGLDYDRIRGKYDEANAALAKSGDALSLLRDLAAAQGITAEQLIDATRTQMLVKQEGLQPAAAAQRVAAMRTPQVNMEVRDKMPEAAATDKRQSDIREFLAEYGTGIDPKSIPQEVWQSVAKGKTLLAAYQTWELKRLKAESSASRKNTENKLRSAGSRQSAGYRTRDEIADNWYDD